VAVALNMKDDTPELNMVLKHLVQDFDWDDEGMGAIYKKEKIVRYHLSGLKGFEKQTNQDTESERTQACSDTAAVSSLQSLTSGSADSSVTIKLENPDGNQFKQLLVLLKSGKGILVVVT